MEMVVKKKRIISNKMTDLLNKGLNKLQLGAKAFSDTFKDAATSFGSKVLKAGALCCVIAIPTFLVVSE
eukprot:gnl/Chilomastix_caulleri/789.p3 GENE.gnl/Chilomastix_caulleri/789~~gnl/Chilomastix_caulleri/789.p3  ORF type:complete len:69 (+),score=23.30 gnl/Chilomastix_caulleri/789:303-509(+)